jgi:hypothetical protein
MMVPSVRTETPMKSELKVEEVLGLDDPKTLALVKDIGTLAKQLKEHSDSHSYLSVFGSDRNQGLKSLRLKTRLLSNLLSSNLRMGLELLIVDCE